MLKMPKRSKRIVINTGPLISLIAGLGDLTLLEKLYKEVIVPHEVKQEMLSAGKEAFGARVFYNNEWLDKLETSTKINSFLSNSLDKGEASVIQVALDKEINTVCIDETVGRRIARLNNLKVTGSLGIIIFGINNGEDINLDDVIKNMRKNGIWISKDLEKEAKRLVKEI